MQKAFLLPILVLLFILTSCSSNNEDIVNPPVNNNITYTDNVKIIIDSKCLNCHTDPPINGARMALTTFQNVKDAVTDRGLIGRVKTGSMPSIGDALTAAQVQTIEDWEAGGFKE